MKYLNFEAVVNLIKQGGFGSYLVFNNLGGELLFGSHITDEANKEVLAMDTEKLIDDLRTKIELYGYGAFRINLKKNNKTQTINSVIYRFEIKPEPGNQQAQQAMAGLGSLGEIESRITKEVQTARESWDREQQIKDLQRQIEELKNGGSGVSNKGMEQLAEVAKMGLGLIVAKVAPESIPMIHGMLGNIENGGTPAKKPDVFNRTD